MNKGGDVPREDSMLDKLKVKPNGKYNVKRRVEITQCLRSVSVIGYLKMAAIFIYSTLIYFRRYPYFE